MILIIYCHPSKKSHNYKILQRVSQTLHNKKKPHKILDLYKIGFTPSLGEIEYERIRKRDRTKEKDVIKIQKEITNAKTLIFIYPIWWYNMPARLKGFFDRVFSAEFAYRYISRPAWMHWGAHIISFIPGLRKLLQSHAAIPLLKGKKALIFRTYGGPSFGRHIFGEPQKNLEEVILHFCGITDITIHELFQIDTQYYSETYEKNYLKKVSEICRKIH